MPSASIVDDHELRELAMPQSASDRRWPGPVVAIAIVVTGVASGVSGMLLGLLLRFVQHVAYGYSLNAIVSQESFLQGVTAASPMRRVIALTTSGAVAGIGWWAVYRFGQPLVSVKSAVGKKVPGPSMPIRTTIAHVLLQILTVAFGSPLGRETAPREMGAMLAGWLWSRAGLTPEERRILIAAGAGAGLAAIYNVPLGGALFTLEVVLGTFTPRALVAAVIASVVATMLAWTALGDVPQFTIPDLASSPSLIAWSIVAGPIFGIAGHGFRAAMRAATANTPQGWHRVLWCLGVFFGLGLLAAPFPQLPGNGKGPLQLGFDGELGVSLAISLLALKALAVAASLRAGAAGGLLTPSLTLGALLGTVLGCLWNLALPSVPTAAVAIVGAAAFLAASMNMPLTAIVLIIEFTRIGYDFWAAISLAVAMSAASLHACARREAQRTGSL
jgi:H+/Cl- antiporter ClcA